MVNLDTYLRRTDHAAATLAAETGVPLALLVAGPTAAEVGRAELAEALRA